MNRLACAFIGQVNRELDRDGEESDSANSADCHKITRPRRVGVTLLADRGFDCQPANLDSALVLNYKTRMRSNLLRLLLLLPGTGA